MLIDFTKNIKHITGEFSSSQLDSFWLKNFYDRIILPALLEMLAQVSCPTPQGQCNARGKMKVHSHYKRKCIRDIVNGVIVDYENVVITRVICMACGTTHALLLWFIPPYSRFTLRFILTVLVEYYHHHYVNIVTLCAKYEIDAPTLYAWCKKYQEQYLQMRSFYTDKLLEKVGMDPGTSPVLLDSVKKRLEQHLILLLLEDANQDQPSRFEEYFRTYNQVFLQIRQGSMVRKRYIAPADPSP